MNAARWAPTIVINGATTDISAAMGPTFTCLAGLTLWELKDVPK